MGIVILLKLVEITNVVTFYLILLGSSLISVRHDSMFDYICVSMYYN